MNNEPLKRDKRTINEKTNGKEPLSTIENMALALKGVINYDIM